MNRLISYAEDSDDFVIYVDGKKIDEWGLDEPTIKEIVSALADALDIEFEDVDTIIKQFPDSI